MTHDNELEIRVLKRVLDWHESPANAPRRLDLSWQDALDFFEIPAASGDEAGADAAWTTLYDALDAMIADGRLMGTLYVNRVRDLRPGYRGAMDLQADEAARLKAERDTLDTLASRLAAERDALDAARASLDVQQENAAATRQHLEQKAQILDTRDAALAATQADLDERQAHFERDRAIARRDLEGERAAAEAEMRAARGWRFAGILALVIALGLVVALAAGQGLILPGDG
jgi:GAF domain-containing protein